MRWLGLSRFGDLTGEPGLAGCKGRPTIVYSSSLLKESLYGTFFNSVHVRIISKFFSRVTSTYFLVVVVTPTNFARAVPATFTS